MVGTSYHVLTALVRNRKIPEPPRLGRTAWYWTDELIQEARKALEKSSPTASPS